MPALLTSRSICGCRSRIAAAARSTSSRSATSRPRLPRRAPRPALEPLPPPATTTSPPAPFELPRRRLADARRRAGDDSARGDSTRRRERTRWASALRPCASVTIARSVCLALRGCGCATRVVDPGRAPADDRDPACWSSKNRTERTAAVEPASTASPSGPRTRWPPARATSRSARRPRGACPPRTPCSAADVLPTESTFFASWKSAAEAVAPLAGLERRSVARQGKSAMPDTGRRRRRR